MTHESGVVHIISKDDMSDALVLLEGEAEFEVKGIEQPNVHSTRSGIKYVCTGILRRGQTIAIHIRSAIGKRITLSVAFLRKEISTAWKKLPCNGCKLLVKIITHAVLAHVGLPLISLINHASFPDVGIHMAVHNAPKSSAVRISKEARDAIGKLGTSNDPSDLSQFLGKLPNWVTIQGVFTAFDWLFEATDRFYAWPCKKLGCCP